jgi:hypothetical protein
MNGLNQRRVAPEWLDALPAPDPRAESSRRDLRRLNWWMGSAGTLARELRPLLKHCRARLPAASNLPQPQLIELGAGDGQLLLRVCRLVSSGHSHSVLNLNLSPTPNLPLLLVERQPACSPGTLAAFARLGWRAQVIQADVFDWLEQQQQPVPGLMVANLFLHHFQAAQLRHLLQLVSERATALVALEPRRRGLSLVFCRGLRLLRCNEVTRHDAPASVRAGFSGRELSRLWPAAAGWSLSERSSGLFGHLFVAVRSGGSLGQHTGPSAQKAAASCRTPKFGVRELARAFSAE